MSMDSISRVTIVFMVITLVASGWLQIFELLGLHALPAIVVTVLAMVVAGFWSHDVVWSAPGKTT